MTIDVAIDNNTVMVENIVLASQWFLGCRRGLYMSRIPARSRSNDDVMLEMKTNKPDSTLATFLGPRSV